MIEQSGEVELFFENMIDRECKNKEAEIKNIIPELKLIRHNHVLKLRELKNKHNLKKVVADYYEISFYKDGIKYSYDISDDDFKLELNDFDTEVDEVPETLFIIVNELLEVVKGTINTFIKTIEASTENSYLWNREKDIFQKVGYFETRRITTVPVFLFSAGGTIQVEVPYNIRYARDITVTWGNM